MSSIENSTQQNPTSTATKANRKSKPVYQPLAGGASKRQTFDVKCSISNGSVKASSSRCPVGVPFVINPESTELYVKLSKACVISLSSGQRYSAEGVDAYFATLV